MTTRPDAAEVFALPGHDCITAEEHLGIKGFMLTAGVPHRDVLAVRGLWAPPFASTDFLLEVRLDGERVPTQDFTWNGNTCRRRGRWRGLEVESVLAAPLEQRACLLWFCVRNLGAMPVELPVQLLVRGAADRVEFWEFAGPAASEAGLPWGPRVRGWGPHPEAAGLLLKRGAEASLVIGTDLEQPRWQGLCGQWEGVLRVEPGQTHHVRVVAALGATEAATAECRSLLSRADALESAQQEWARQVEEVFARLPRLEASDPRLTAYYDRSLVHLLLNKWRVPDFVVSPYYSTGGINGGCVCCYLWDFGEPWEILPLYDPEALRSHVRQFLTVDITHHFAWVPTTGQAFGPWYPVNQEKIIFLIYYYVLFTGDLGFLREEVAGRTVLAWVLFHATYRDSPELPVSLIDYGKGNNHLELRGAYRYDNILPDLNGRRYASYLAAGDLARLAGEPAEGLVERAHALKGLLRRMMWSPQDRWFHHLDENYAPGLCYTVQILKLIGSGVLDEEELEGLVSHLNEGEFLSAYGLHSMSKLDEAYDQIDIDNGGGGNYTAFTPQIVERLYKAGRPELAEDILRRVLWWGERLPYWGDSIVANHVDYRRDTPLQNTIGALAGAQCIIFGMFGVRVDGRGAITVDPRAPSFSPRVALRGLRLRGRCLDIAVEDGQYRVTVDGRTVTAAVGTPTVLPAALDG